MRPRLLILLAAAMALAGLPAAASAALHPPFHVSDRPGGGIEPTRNLYTVPEAPKSPDCGPDFCVHWVDEGLDAPSLKDSNGDGVPDFVARVLAAADPVPQVKTVKLGWREPLSDGPLGGGHGKTDIYLTELGDEQLFGYAAP